MNVSSRTSRAPGSSSRVSPRMSAVRSAFDLAQAFHLAQAVATLYELTILDALSARPATARALAARYRLDRAVLEGVMDFVAARTNILRKKGGAFSAARRHERETRFL